MIVDSEHPRHLPAAAVDGNPIAVSTRLGGPTNGDSFSSLCLVLQTDLT